MVHPIQSKFPLLFFLDLVDNHWYNKSKKFALRKDPFMTINNKELDTLEFDKYLIGDSTQISNHFKGYEPFIDLTVTSPPYWDVKQYGEVAQTGFGQTYEDYKQSIAQIFQGVYDLSKPNASLYVNVDTIKRNGKIVRLQDDITNILERIGWIHRDIIIWDKGKTLPWSRKGQMRNIFEYVLFFTKSNNYKYNIDSIKTVEELKEWWHDYPERYNPEGKVPENIWRFNIPTQGSWGSKETFEDEEFRHACPFPPEMMARIIRLSSDPGDIVFDPFAGTGVLLSTAQLLNRRYLGIDTNEKYKNVFEKVTKSLVSKQWIRIEKHYQEQEMLKQIMKTSILRLRMLKYPKSIIKRLRSNDDLKGLESKIIFILAAQENLSDNLILENKRDVIGKVRYYFVIDVQNDELDQLKYYIDSITSKAPFSKYGLITEVKLLNKKDLRKVIKKHRIETLYSYINGNTKSYFENIQLDELRKYINKLLRELAYPDGQSREYPTILSNISILSDEYAMIPAEKYQRKK